QAARDALCAVERVSDVWNTYPSAWARAAQFGVESRTWMKIYKPMVAMLVVGLETFASELRAEYRRVKIQTPESGCKVLMPDRDVFNNGLRFGPQSGNSIANYGHRTDSGT